MGAKGKRKKSQSSPNTVDVGPDKRQQIYTSPGNMSVASSEPLQTPVGAYQPLHLYANTPPTGSSGVLSQTGPFYTPQQYVPSVSCMSQSPQQNNELFQDRVLKSLASMEQRLSKLDVIEQQLSDVSSKLNKMDMRVSSLESSAHESNRRLSELEASRAHDSQTCDEILSKQNTIDKSLKEHNDHRQALTHDLTSLQRETTRLSEEMLDIQSRSMRDNLLFFGFREASTAEDRRAENCADSVLRFCADTLLIPDATGTVKIERAHRIGR